MGDNCSGEDALAGNSNRVILFSCKTVHLQFAEGCMIFLRCRFEQTFDILLRDDASGSQSGEDAFTEPEFHFRFIFCLGHSDTSYRNDSILPDLR